MDVAADGDGCGDVDDVCFFDEEFAGFVADLADERFGDDAAGSEVFDCSVVVVSTGGRGLKGERILVEVAHGGREVGVSPVARSMGSAALEACGV